MGDKDVRAQRPAVRKLIREEMDVLGLARPAKILSLCKGGWAIFYADPREGIRYVDVSEEQIRALESLWGASSRAEAKSV